MDSIWKKYNIKYTNEQTYPNRPGTYTTSDNTKVYKTADGWVFTAKSVYTNYTIDSSTGSVTGVDAIYNKVESNIIGKYMISGNEIQQINSITWPATAPFPDPTCYVYYTVIYELASIPTRDSYIEDVTAPAGTYPDNGLASDGFWYVKIPKVDEISLKIDSQIKKFSSGWVKIDGVLRKISSISIKVEDSIKKIF